MRRHGIGIVVGVFLVSLVSFPVNKAYAGSINSAEAGLIDYLKGTFTYEGHTYKASSAALAVAKAKLSEDGVDLTQAQVQKAIAQSSSYVATAVYEGYLVRVDGGETDKTQNSDQESGKDNLPQDTTDKENTTDKGPSTGNGSGTDNSPSTGNESGTDNSPLTGNESGTDDTPASDSESGTNNEPTIGNGSTTNNEPATGNGSTTNNESMAGSQPTQENKPATDKNDTLNNNDNERPTDAKPSVQPTKKPSSVVIGYDKVTISGDIDKEQIDKSTVDSIINSNKLPTTVEQYLEGTVAITNGEEVIFNGELPVKNTGYTIQKGLRMAAVLGVILIMVIASSWKYILFAKRQDGYDE